MTLSIVILDANCYVLMTLSFGFSVKYGMTRDLLLSCRRRRFTPREMRARGMGEVVDFVNNKERMGESMAEVAKESFNSSEL
jgi:hypothetical protein